MIRESGTTDQLFLLNELDDLKEHLLKILLAGNRSACIFSRNLNSHLFNNNDIADVLSKLARSHSKSEIRILIDNPKLLVEQNHKLLQLYRRLPSKISIQNLIIKPQDDYEFVIIDSDKLWLHHKPDTCTGFANYDARAEVKRFQETFKELWKNSETDVRLRELSL